MITLNQHKNDEKTMFDYVNSRYGRFEVYHLLQENIPIEEVFEKLKCSKEGLKSDEVEARLSVFGYNKLEEKKVSEPYFSFFFYGTFIYQLFHKAISSLFFSDSYLYFHFLKESKILKFLGFMWNPLSWVMEAAAIVAIAVPRGEVIP